MILQRLLKSLFKRNQRPRFAHGSEDACYMHDEDDWPYLEDALTFFAGHGFNVVPGTSFEDIARDAAKKYAGVRNITIPVLGAWMSCLVPDDLTVFSNVIRIEKKPGVGPFATLGVMTAVKRIIGLAPSGTFGEVHIEIEYREMEDFTHTYIRVDTTLKKEPLLIGADNKYFDFTFLNEVNEMLDGKSEERYAVMDEDIVFFGRAEHIEAVDYALKTSFDKRHQIKLAAVDETIF